MHVRLPASPATGVVVSNERCTASSKSAGFMRHVTIDVSKTELAGTFRSGQSFGVIPPGQDAAGKPHKVRLYSLSCPTRGEDGRGGVISTTVKRLIDEHQETGKLFLGVASNYICDLKPGDEVKVSGPNGKRFLLPANPGAHDYVFFATGTGIAPFRGMLRDLFGPEGSAGTARAVLITGSPYATDVPYHQEMQELAASSGGRFEYRTAISRERQPDGGKPMYVQDRLASDRDLLVPLLSSGRGLVYVCGIAGMELGILQGMARTLGAEALEQYVKISDAARGDPSQWNRRMIHKDVAPTRRMFLEVY